MEIRELLQKRAALWDKAKNFLDTHTDKDGKISARDSEIVNKMEEDIDALSRTIEHYERSGRIGAELEKPFNTPYFEPFGADPFKNATRPTRGIQGAEYRKEFFNQIRKGFKSAQNYLREGGDPALGGYLLPTEFDTAIVSKLEETNVMRQISRVIQTASEHKFVLVAEQPQAAVVSEGQTIEFSSEQFDSVSLGAHKIATGIRLTNEVLADSYYNLEAHLVDEFGKAIGRLEESLFITGTGQGQPTGVLYTVAASQDRYISTSEAGVSADDIINLQYSLPRAYRKNACFLTSDETLARIRKLKDADQNYIWTPSLVDSEPPKLLGASIYTSPFMPPVQSGAIPVLYGDFSAFVIGERGERIFKPLYELYALSDLTAYLMIKRIDSVLVDKAAIKGLYVS